MFIFEDDDDFKWRNTLTTTTTVRKIYDFNTEQKSILIGWFYDFQIFEKAFLKLWKNEPNIDQRDRCISIDWSSIDQFKELNFKQIPQ